MFEPTIIFQRTHGGRVEIHEKKRGLTQSERLVLIMVDGVANYAGVRAKLPVLTDQRFERAIHTLLQKELISEVFMPLEGQSPEEVDRLIVDRFLQQDPLDPVTIILTQDDERMDLHVPGPVQGAPTVTEAGRIDESGLGLRGEEGSELGGLRAEAASASLRAAHEENDARETEEIVEQIRASQPHREHSVQPTWMPPQEDPVRTPERWFPSESTIWLYMGIAVIGAFILGYATGRLTL